MLTENLRSLQRDSYLSRTAREGPPVAVSYALTAQGQSLVANMWPLVDWAKENMASVKAARLDYGPVKTAEIMRLFGLPLKADVGMAWPFVGFGLIAVHHIFGPDNRVGSGPAYLAPMFTGRLCDPQHISVAAPSALNGLITNSPP